MSQRQAPLFTTTLRTPQPKHRKPNQTIIFCYTVMMFYVFPPIQIKPHVGG